MYKLFAAVVVTLLLSTGAQATIVEPVVAYRLEGTWFVGGPSSNGKPAPTADTNPRVYSGLEAAETIFGESPTGYAISTNPLSFEPGDVVYIFSDGTYKINGNFQKDDKGFFLHYIVNMLTFLDGFGDSLSPTIPKPQAFSKDVAPPGYSNPQMAGAAYSAWVSDHAAGMSALNYAFVPVPEPQTWTLMLGGGVLLALFRSARKISSRV